jgi:phosphoribosyl 1,2-cyclic phosphodiesterase
MSVELCVLASGSGGNCSVVRSPGGVVLIDAGLGPRQVAQRLAGTAVCVNDVSAICLTHLDRDHFNPNWLPTVVRRDIRLFCHSEKVGDVLELAAEHDLLSSICGFDANPFEAVPGLTVRPLAFAHDSTGSHGFVIDGFGCRLGYATDLGHVPNDLVEHFCDLDLLAIESNYDQRMQVESPRPWFLKRRIMGGQGHLSNEQAYDAVRRVLNRCQARAAALPEHIVLLHRSRQCNCPALLRAFFSRDERIAARLVLAEQDERTEWLRAAREQPFVGPQLELAWG